MPLIVSPDTILRRHRGLIRRRHACISRTKHPARPPTRRCIQVLVPRLARENSHWDYRRIHGELATLEITLAPCAVWQILHRHGIQPAPDRDHTTWPTFPRGQAQAIVAGDFLTATTLTCATYYLFAVIEHATRRVRILGATVHPTGAWVTQIARNPVMDLQHSGADVNYLIRDRDTTFTQAFDTVLTCEGIETVTTGIRMPRTNPVMQRWIETCPRELLDRTLTWNHTHPLQALPYLSCTMQPLCPAQCSPSVLHNAAPLSCTMQPH
jgi:hypothetical protein